MFRKMLSFKKLFCLSLIAYTVCGNIIPNRPLKYDTTKAFQKPYPTTAVPSPPSSKCAPDKSLNSINDIKVMIDHIYNEKSLDQLIKQNYESLAEDIRDKHLQDLNDFTAWFENQPGHLKDVLRRLDRLRKINVEPVVEKVAGVLTEYPELEELFNDKNERTNELENRFHRYNMICKFNCEDQEIEGHYIAKRSTRGEYYCSSIEDLHKSITQNLDDFVEKLNDNITEKLNLDDKQYEEKIDEIKSTLKDKALKEFGRTMYDILSLEDEYDHFMDDITSTDLFSSVYSIKSLGLQIDAKLLELEHAIEKYGQHCNSCRSKSRIRNVRQTELEFKENEEMEPFSLVIQLIEVKFHDIAEMVENDYENIFHDLNTLIEGTETQEFTLEKLQPVQDEVDSMTNAEKEALHELKQQVPKISIKKILELIKKLKDILKRIQDILDKLPGYTFQK